MPGIIIMGILIAGLIHKFTSKQKVAIWSADKEKDLGSTLVKTNAQ